MVDYLEKAELAARKAADYIHLKSGLANISSSELHDLKLKEDSEVEILIRSLLEETSIPVIGEESYSEHDYDTYWLVDPIDGSVNYFKGLPLYSVAICLIESGKCTVSVVLDVCRNRLYTAKKGFGSFCNGKQISVSNVKYKSEALMLSAITPAIQSNLDEMSEYMATLASTKKIRMIGSAALSLCYLAEGVADMCDLKKVHIWDVFAAALIVEEAGGRVELIQHEGTTVSIKANNSLIDIG